MIEEIPICAGEILYVRSDRDKAPSRLEAPAGIGQHRHDGGFMGQMLQKITGEDRIERFVWKRPGLGAVLEQDGNILGGVPVNIRIEIHGILDAGDRVVDELAVSGTEIENGPGAIEIAAEKRRENPPDLIAVLSSSGESNLVDSL